jgi:hypothetical protein
LALLWQGKQVKTEAFPMDFLAVSFSVGRSFRFLLFLVEAQSIQKVEAAVLLVSLDMFRVYLTSI